jgi:alpha-N-arabinofuranosidase
MILTQGEQMLVTPTGYVYEMYAPHQGAKSLRLRIETPEIYFEKKNVLQVSWQSAMRAGEKMESSIPTVSGSASLKDNALFVTLTNSHASQPADVVVEVLGGAEIGSAEGQVLCGDIHAHNTFDAPEQVAPQSFAMEWKKTLLHVVLPAAAVATVKLHLTGRNH